jgi:predicted HicB family RNase H-like nuclease
MFGEDDRAMVKLLERFRSYRKGGATSEAVARKERETKIRAAIDGKGRTEQFNFKCRPGTKAAVKQAAKAGGKSIAEWMEAAIEQQLTKRIVQDA